MTQKYHLVSGYASQSEWEGGAPYAPESSPNDYAPSSTTSLHLVWAVSIGNLISALYVESATSQKPKQTPTLRVVPDASPRSDTE